MQNYMTVKYYYNIDKYDIENIDKDNEATIFNELYVEAESF